MAQPTGPSSIREVAATHTQIDHDVRTLLEQAKREEHVSKKQDILETAFTLLKKEPSERIYQLLHQYAKETCYNIGDQGMLQTRILMLWSLRGQLTGSSKACLSHDSLALLKRDAPADDSLPEVPLLLQQIASCSDEEKELVAQTLILLGYATQNIEEYNTSSNLPWHQRNYDLVLAIWEAKAQKGDLLEKQAEFRYNKDALLLELQGRSDAEQIAALNPVLELFALAWGNDSERYKGKESQVRNRQAISEYQTKTEGWLTRALAYAEEALLIRERMPVPEDSWEHLYLLANARQVLSRLLAEGEPPKEQLLRATGLIQKSLAFAEEWKQKGKNDSYFEGYYRISTYIQDKLSKKAT